MYLDAFLYVKTMRLIDRFSINRIVFFSIYGFISIEKIIESHRL